MDDRKRGLERDQCGRGLRGRFCTDLAAIWSAALEVGMVIQQRPPCECPHDQLILHMSPFCYSQGHCDLCWIYDMHQCNNGCISGLLTMNKVNLELLCDFTASNNDDITAVTLNNHSESKGVDIVHFRGL